MKTFLSTDILDRLKTALSMSSDKDLGEALGVSKAAISNWRKRNSIDFERVFSICEHINIDWLMTGEGNMLRSDSSEAPVDLSSSLPISSKSHNATRKSEAPKGAIPLVSEKAVGGFYNSDFNISEYDIKGYYVIPKFRHLGINFMIEVSGDSMIPRFYPGDIIACSIISNPNFIQWNKCHLIATREQGLIIKRLMPGDAKDCLKAVSDNKDYPPFDIPKDEICGLARIVGTIHLE